MTDSKESRWLKRLAAEFMEALAEVRKNPAGLNEAVLAEVLGNRRRVQDLVRLAARADSVEVADDENELTFGKLQEKYNLLRDDLISTENQKLEIEDAFARLIRILAALAEETKQPGLDKELRILKDNLKRKIVPGRLDASTNALKNFVMRGGPGEDGAALAGPESIEENVRDILLILIQDISMLEEPEIQKRAGILKRKVKNDFTLEDYEPFIHQMGDLIYQVKEVFRKKNIELRQFTDEVISQLEDAEQDLLKTLLGDVSHLGEAEETFARKVAQDIRGIEQSFRAEGASLPQIRTKVFEKIASIRKHFQEKRAVDQARLKLAEEEKSVVENRLKDVHERYQKFARESEAALREMEKFRQASFQDGLTGARNRRAYDLQINKALRELKEGGLTKLALIVFDVDNFKDFNNNYGHRAGDLTLKYVVRLSTSHLRKEDFMARFGGDEFTVIMPETPLKAAVQTAEKIRSGMAGVEFKIYKDRDVTVRVNLSMGVAEARPDDTVETFFQRADEALYLAKEKGRNQVRSEKELAGR